MTGLHETKPAPPEKLTVGLIQLAFKTGDLDYNIQEAARLVDEAAHKGAQLIVLPEIWSIGFKVEDLSPFAETLTEGRTLDFMIGKAKEHQVYICGGFLEKNPDGGPPYNSALVIDPQGKIIHNHRKVQLYTPGGEDLIFTAGNRFDVVNTPLGRWGVLICYDGDFPEAWRILAAVKGADLVIHSTAYESPCEELGWWPQLYEASALTNAVWAVSAHLCGQTAVINGQSDNYFGGSCIIDPMGNSIDHLSYVKPNESAHSEVLVKELDFAAGLKKGREMNGVLVMDRRPDVYHQNGL